MDWVCYLYATRLSSGRLIGRYTKLHRYIYCWCNRVMACPKEKTQFGLNHIGHFLFTSFLLPRIRNSTPTRIVNVSLMAHTSQFKT